MYISILQDSNVRIIITVCGGMYLGAHMHASVCIWIWESTLGVIPWESSVLRFEAGSLIGTWDSLSWLSGKCQGSFCLPLLSAGIKRAHCHVWLSSMDLGSAKLLRRQSLHTEWQPGPSSIWIPVTHTFPLFGPFLFLASFPPISFCLCLL